MLRRTLLAPVICLIIAGFIVASHSPLQARTTDKNIKPTDIARQHREKQAGQDAPDASVSQGVTDKASQHKGSSTKPSVKKRKKSGTSQKAVIHKKSARSTNHAKHAAGHSKNVATPTRGPRPEKIISLLSTFPTGNPRTSGLRRTVQRFTGHSGRKSSPMISTN